VKFVSLATAVATLAACGGGGTSTPAVGGTGSTGSTGSTGGTGGASGTGGIPIVNSTTAVISDNMAANYGLEQNNVAATNQACFRQWGMSGNALSCATSAKKNEVSKFISNVLPNIRAVNGAQAIDKVAIVALINQYKDLDSAWLNTNTFGATFTMTSSEVSALAATYNPALSAFYSDFLLQVNAL
jgi:hypothetical protein